MKRLIPAFNVLGVVSGCLMIVSMLFPWWRVAIVGRAGTNVYPYVISGAAAELLGYKRSTQMIIVTCVLIICIVLCFVGSVLKGRKGRYTLGAVGILALLATLGFVYRISQVCKRYEISLQGTTVTTAEMVPIEVKTGFQAGIYWMVFAGLLCLVSSALHEKLRLRLG